MSSNSQESKQCNKDVEVSNSEVQQHTSLNKDNPKYVQSEFSFMDSLKPSRPEKAGRRRKR